MTLAATREEAASAELSARLHDPAVAASLVTLLDHADLLAIIAVSLDGFIARSDVIGDSLVDGVTELRAVMGATESDFDPAALLSAVKSLAGSLPQLAPSVVAAVESGAFDQVNALVAGLAQGSAEFETSPVQVTGALSLLRLLKDPDINRAISYAATVARALGRELGATAAPSPK